MKKSDSNDIALNLEVQYLRDQITKLKSENSKLLDIVKENDLLDELEDVSAMSDEESICVNEIRNLKELSDKGQFTQEDAKTLDILYKNLRAIRGMSPIKKEKKAKPMNKAELFSLLEGKK